MEYRVWCKDNNEWEKNLCYLSPSGILYHNRGMMWIPLKRKNHIVQFYIGLDDWNKKKIYTGDIIKAINRKYDCEDNREDYFQTFKVTYLNGCVMFGNWNSHEFFNKFMYIEVVGNIFKNSELLED